MLPNNNDKMSAALTSLYVASRFVSLVGALSASGTVLDYCRKISGSIHDIFTFKNINVNNFLEDLDLECKLNTIESVMQILDNRPKEVTDVLEDDETGYLLITKPKDALDEVRAIAESPIDVVLLHLKRTTHKIHKIMNNLHYKIEYHDGCYFSNWRALNVDVEMHLLKRYTTILEGQIKLLFQVMSIVRRKDAPIEKTEKEGELCCHEGEKCLHSH